MSNQLPIDEYAVLGDGRTAALVSRRGSVDWLCLPRFDSRACFAALLGTADNGRWVLTVPDADSVSRRYLDDSFVLETTYESATGTAVVQESMPLGDGRADLVRRITCTRGRVDVLHEWVVRFGYGQYKPWMQRVTDSDGRPAIRAIAGPDSLVLHGDRLPRAVDHRHEDRFTLEAGSSVTLTLTWSPSWQPVACIGDVAKGLAASARLWSSWAERADVPGPYREAVVRSLLVLRLLTHAETGGIVAAVTTSLPETFGGARNWDYRFTWLRDAALTLEALLEHGYLHETEHWRSWLLRAVAGAAADIQIMYRLDGSRELGERTLDHLAGYADSRPVRVGNAAAGQVQHDVLGEVMCALEMARVAGIEETATSWALQRNLIDHLVSTWREPDAGIWESRGQPQAFTHSRAMSWAALDRAVKAVEDSGLPGDVERWRAARDAVHADVLAHGWSDAVGSFVQYPGATHTDASLLQMFQVGFLPADDPRMLATLDAVRRELEVAPGLVLRYRTEKTDDGVGGVENPFLACSFWLADALARADRVDEAGKVLDVLVGLTNDVGLLSEEYDPANRRLAGNTPQALSHLALVRAVHQYELAQRRRTP